MSTPAPYNQPQDAATHALGVEVLGASKTFGTFRALDKVSIKVAPGTIHALLGENGAGKSTLVKGLVGYGLLDEGQITADGREANDRGFECTVLADCCGATDKGNHDAALHMITMQGGVFGTVSDSHALLATLGR